MIARGVEIEITLIHFDGLGYVIAALWIFARYGQRIDR